MAYTAAVITVSDLGSRGQRVDTSGPAICAMLEKAGFTVTYTAIVPDEQEKIREALIDCADERHIGLYQTPIGQDMTIATHTSRVSNTVGENGGQLIIDYTVEVDNSLMGEHHFEMVVS